MRRFNRGRRNNRGRGGGSRANNAARDTQSSPSVKGAGAGRNKALITKRHYDARTWPADKMAWMIYLASTIVSLAFEPGAIKQVEDDELTDDDAGQCVSDAHAQTRDDIGHRTG